MNIGAETSSPSAKATVCGVNYEGGKILEHAYGFKSCAYAVNLQIAMDAPFAGEVAVESLRAKGRSETFFTGYDETYTMARLRQGISVAVLKCREEKVKLLIVQIARGRSAKEFEEKLSPLVSEAKEVEVKYVHGYRTTSYFAADDIGASTFVFVNIGMFARLSPQVKPGEVFVPSMSIDVAWSDHKTRDKLHILKTRDHSSTNVDVPLPRMVLIGIEDSMDFVTPEHYKEDHFTTVLQKCRRGSFALEES